MQKAKTTHEAIIGHLIPDERRDDFETRVQALIGRNKMLAALEEAREELNMPKAQLAKRAGLEQSSVRRMLTAETANPTTDTTFRMMAAMGIGCELILPGGARVPVV